MNIDSIGKGDLIQFAPSKKKDPIHAGMVTGTYKDEFNDRELPTLTYSRGGTGITTQTDEGNKPTMVHNRPWGEIVEKKDYRYPTAYRYIGSPQKQQEWTNEYNNKYGTQRSNGRLGVTARWAEGGFLQPRDAWDRLSIAEQAAMMKAAVSEGIFDLSEIRKRYNEFAEGGNIYSGEEEKTQQMEKRPITTGGAGYIPPTSDIDIRQRLYDNIVPFGYKHPVVAEIALGIIHREKTASNSISSPSESSQREYLYHLFFKLCLNRIEENISYQPVTQCVNYFLPHLII